MPILLAEILRLRLQHQVLCTYCLALLVSYRPILGIDIYRLTMNGPITFLDHTSHASWFKFYMVLFSLPNLSVMHPLTGLSWKYNTH